MNRLRLASVVAVFALFTFDRGGEFRRARADDAATGSVDEPVGTDLDPWSGEDGLESPLGDPWRSPQQVQRGPRAGQGAGLVYKTRITPHWFHGDAPFLVPKRPGRRSP